MFYLIFLSVCIYVTSQLLLVHQSKKKIGVLSTIFFSWLLVVSSSYFLKQYQLIVNINSLVLFPKVGDITKASLIIFAILIIIFSIKSFLQTLNLKQQIAQIPAYHRHLNRLVLVISTVLIFVAFLFYLSCKWSIKSFGDIGIDQIIMTLTQPLKGTDSSQIFNYLTGPLLSAAFFTTLAITIISNVYALLTRDLKLKKYSEHSVFYNISVVFSALLIFFISSYLGASEFGIAEVKAYFFETTKIFEEHYVNPKEVKLTFPAQKRNLIYIYVESLESTYLSKDKGGAENDNLLPNLTQMLDDGAINFSNRKEYGGATSTPATAFTLGGLIAQSSGIPIKIPSKLEKNDYYRNSNKIIPGAYALGDVLKKEGYTQTFMLGSDSSFAGRDKFFKEHGSYKIVDYYSAIKNKWIPSDYSVWWGFEDKKLFENAKSVVTDMYKTDQPFNFTLLTADTHADEGYMSDETPKIFDKQYSNVIHFSDEMIGEFINWVKTQPFYENTTIIVAGDHLSMSPDYFNDLPDNYQRNSFDLIDNSVIPGNNLKNRKFNTMDMYPTTLASLGVKIEGDRMGLGTNLFSNEPTLMEKIGTDKFNSEVSKRSKYYNKYIAMTN